MKNFIRNAVNARFINPFLLDGLYRLGLNSTWIRNHFYRIGKFTRHDISMIGTIWEPVAQSVFWGGKYGFESEMSRLFENDVNNSSTVLDIGAYTGYYSFISAHKGAKVFAFEPSLKTRDLLVKNIALNNVDVTVMPIGLSDESGYAELFTPSGDVDSGASLDGKYGGLKENVRLVTLDQFSDFFGIKSLDVIKLDVERHEPQVLKGGLKTISRFKPIIYIEILPDTDTSSIEKYLHDYKFEHLTDKGPIPKNKLIGDNVWRNYRCYPK